MEVEAMDAVPRINLNKVPKVSICVVTYNQEKYIRQCLQSIVDQEADFNFQVFVADDCSTDGTPDIVKEFADNYPGKIISILREKNIGPQENYLLVHEMANSDYIAHVDGDDYWLPGKLKFQISMLEMHPYCEFIADYIGEKKIKTDGYLLLNKLGVFEAGNPILHSSKIYKISCRPSLSVFNGPTLDFEINMRNLNGSGFCILTERKTTVHRVVSSSIRANVNDRIVAALLNTVSYAASQGATNLSLEVCLNKNLRSFMSTALVNNDIAGIYILIARFGLFNNYIKKSNQLLLRISVMPSGFFVLRNFILFKRWWLKIDLPK